MRRGVAVGGGAVDQTQDEVRRARRLGVVYGRRVGGVSRVDRDEVGVFALLRAWFWDVVVIFGVGGVACRGMIATRSGFSPC
jgi:hypothetical protein